MKNQTEVQKTSADLPLEVTGVVHHYGDKAALQGVDLKVRQGEIFALLGPNGSGKSTLFRLISTLVSIQQIVYVGEHRSEVISA